MIAMATSMTALVISACARDVAVGGGGGGSGGSLGTVTPPTDSAGSGAPGNSPGAGSSAGPGGPTAPGDSGGTGSVSDAGTAPSGNLMDGIDQVATPGGSMIEAVEVLAEFLSSIEVPAVGSDGVSLLQYRAPEQAFVLHVDWSRNTRAWYESGGPYFAYTAANADRHFALLHDMGVYGLHEGGDSTELSGTPSAFKEALSVNGQGIAWVHYQMQPGSQAPVFGTTSFGAIVFQPWGGAHGAITDALRYRARIDISETHVAFVEYADTAAGTSGQVVVQPIAGGAAIAAAPSAHHQDRPAIDGDWVVWEEYLNDVDAVIRARNLSTGEVRDLSSTTGFRTNPDIRGTRVAWEDQRSGRGDIYFIDLASEQPERVAVSGLGHSAATRLTADGLVWIETVGSNIGLMRARFVL